jgi:hypothetical protein
VERLEADKAVLTQEVSQLEARNRDLQLALSARASVS